MVQYTDCECPSPGWCARHHCTKGQFLHQRCQRDPQLFAAWERGDGPCLPDELAADPAAGRRDARLSRVQNSDAASALETDEAATDEPGLMRKAMNLGAAIARHAANGLKSVTDELYASRLAICRDCPSCDVERLVCREKSCGCFLQTKARWASETCPLQKWPVEKEG